MTALTGVAPGIYLAAFPESQVMDSRRVLLSSVLARRKYGRQTFPDGCGRFRE
jgi:hypothetical protein